MTHAMPLPPQPHPEEWEHDWNPDLLAGITSGLEGPRAEQVVMLTADEIETLHERLPVCSREDLNQIPIRPEGRCLEQGATARDRAARLWAACTATADMEAGPTTLYVPRSEVPYQIGNRLLGGHEPKEPDAVKAPDGGGGP